MDAQHDWFAPVRAEQGKIAEAIGRDKLIPFFVSCEGCIGIPYSPEVDPLAAAALKQSNLLLAAHKAVIGYSDCLASAMIRSKTFTPRRLVIPGDNVIRGIAEYMTMSAPIVRFVITCVNEEPQLPILGKVCHGILYPDAVTIKRWASFYDWTA